MRDALRMLALVAALMPFAHATADIAPPPLQPQSPTPVGTRQATDFALVVFSGAPYETVLIEQIDDTQNVLGRINGIAAMVDGTIWQVENRQTLALTASCPEVDDIMNPPSFFRKLTSMRLEVVDAPRFTSVDGATAFGPEILSMPLSEQVDFGEFSGELTILGIANDVVFARQCVDEYMCESAHGGVGCRFVAYDLQRRAERPLSDFVSPEQVADAIEAVRAAPSAEMRDCAIMPEDSTSWSVEAVRPVYTEGDALLYALVTVDSAYACSMDCWSSYTTCTWERVGDWEIDPIRLSFPLQGDDMAIGVTRWSSTDPGGDAATARVRAFFETANGP